MTRRRLLLFSAHVLAACAVWLLAAPAARATGDGLPSFLADDEYWRIVTGFSERPGTFPSDNLLSNERLLQEVIPDLARIAKPNEVFLGVGPEQNFTYIAALKPRMAFIVDIRRGNLDLHLMYKALFELSADRAEFVSRLFSKSRPIGLSSTSSVSEIFDAYVAVDSSDSLYVENLRAIVAHLTKTHGFSLSADDMLRLQRTHRAFYIYGPNIQYSSTRSGGRRDEPTYRDLMLATDSAGQQRSFLASEEAFAFVKDLETSNLVVPLIGNFTGPKAIRAIARVPRREEVDRWRRSTCRTSRNICGAKARGTASVRTWRGYLWTSRALSFVPFAKRLPVLASASCRSWGSWLRK